jgi:DNA-binding GntR family transcriptional regulator
VTIARTVLREQVKQLLLERILDGRYRPGDRLVETRIAEELGTSQAPVREALRDLELLRFVESEPFRGARVRAFARNELLEIYPVRAALEEVAAREAARRLDGAGVAALRAELDGMRRAAGSGDLHAQVEHDVRFHRLIVEASGNRTLLDVWVSLRIEARTIVTMLSIDTDPYDLADMHAPILDALEAGEPDRAGDAVRSHLEHFGELFRATPEGGAP